MKKRDIKSIILLVIAISVFFFIVDYIQFFVSAININSYAYEVVGECNGFTKTIITLVWIAFALITIALLLKIVCFTFRMKYNTKKIINYIIAFIPVALGALILFAAKDLDASYELRYSLYESFCSSIISIGVPMLIIHFGSLIISARFDSIE